MSLILKKPTIVQADGSHKFEHKEEETGDVREGILEKPVLGSAPDRPINSATAHRPRKTPTLVTNEARDNAQEHPWTPDGKRTSDQDKKSRHRNTPGPGRASEPATRNTKADLLHAF